MSPGSSATLRKSTATDLWVSWDEYHGAIERLIVKVHESGWKFDQVLCLARGGLRPGDVFSRVFDVPLAILSTSSYRDESGTVRGRLDIGQNITTTNGPLAGRVLLIDDLVDSGVTLEKVQAQVKLDFPAITEMRSAVIWTKACSTILPDYYLEFLATDPWIHQPFEDYETIRPEELAARIKGTT